MIKKEHYGIINNNEISVYTLTNSAGVEVSATDFGATILKIVVPLSSSNSSSGLNSTRYKDRMPWWKHTSAAAVVRLFIPRTKRGRTPR